MLLELADDFGRFGLGIKSFEMGRLPCVKPCDIGRGQCQGFDVGPIGRNLGLGATIDQERIEAIFIPHSLPRINSIRPPHARRINEPLLREMEATPHSGQYNRPPHLWNLN